MLTNYTTYKRHLEFANQIEDYPRAQPGGHLGVRQRAMAKLTDLGTYVASATSRRVFQCFGWGT